MDLVQTESHASQPEGVNSVGMRIATLLERNGFTVERLAGQTQAAAWLTELMLPEHEYRGLGDVWHLHRDGVGQRILILGDLDTAFLPGCLQRFPYHVAGDIAFGPGVADAKGGLVVLAGAVELLTESDRGTPPLSIVLSPDEQAGSLISRPVIEAAAQTAVACLCLECARDGGNLMGARACCGVASVTIRGREAHAGTDHRAGLSAIAGVANVVDALDGISDPGAGRFVTVTQVRGGWRRSVVPGECSFTLDLRLRDSAEWQQMEDTIRGILHDRAEVRGFGVEANFAQHRPSVLRSPSSEPLITTVLTAGRALGCELGVVSSHAAGSSAFAGLLPVVDGMGPPGGSLMTTEEHVSLSGVAERACLLALTLLSLAR